MIVRGTYLTWRANRIALLIGILSIAMAVWGAAERSWLCDDAFISFRYAENFVRGSGLVYNVNEHVEGYTNFLWTIWIAFGLSLGVDAETWAVAWGIVFYAATILLLISYHFRLKEDLKQTRFTVPVAALLGALHADWMIYATSGLETSLLTFLVVAGYLLLVNSRNSHVFLVAAGLLFALSSLTRPDAVIFGSIAFLFVLAVKRPSIRSAFLFSIPMICILVPFLLWRLSYYGDIFPNTYYAKSGNLSWYSQGLFYFWLYFQKYWILFSGILLVLPALFKNKTRIRKDGALALAFTMAYSFYVIRVGGDFMYGRLLIPITPFLLILLELGLIRFFAVPAAIYAGVIACLCVVLIYSTDRMSGPGGIRGITNEWFYYKNIFPNWRSETKEKAKILNRYFDGLPVRLAFFGGEARLMYYLPSVAIECETGLTDSFIAHLPLKKRGRVGHEKKAPPDYLILQRKLHFSFAPHAAETLKLNEAIPNMEIDFDGIRGRVLHWDPQIMSALRARGAKFVDFPQAIDQYIKHIKEVPRQKIARDFNKLKLFYFDFVDDPIRKNAIESALRQ